jgi:holo-ACP synthase/triphosphoribosyl-dephospho-CoA synthase
VYNADAIEQTDPAGDFFIVPVSASQLSISGIKTICETFEENHPYGRFLDVDVADSIGIPVSSGKAKLCFYCGKRPAIVCRREETHDLNELRSFMFSRMEDFCMIRRETDISKKLAMLALNAILTEVSLTPKPGLVDKLSRGSHTDMNYQVFLSSSTAISTWFGDLVREGFHFKENDLAGALPVIRNIGLRMERDMYAATNNVNTQKGLIFLMGLSLFASGLLFAQQKAFEVNPFREIIKQICKGITGKELETNKYLGNTHGEQVYIKHHVSGARGEAEKGFPTVFDFGLPVLMKYPGINDEALIRAFLAIASNNNDTNIIYRSEMNVLDGFKALALKVFNDYSPENYSRLIEYCRKENISPGGSAFIHSLIQPDDNIV